jgi:hypothetical protein
MPIQLGESYLLTGKSLRFELRFDKHIGRTLTYAHKVRGETVERVECLAPHASMFPEVDCVVVFRTEPHPPILAAGRARYVSVFDCLQNARQVLVVTG